MRKELYLKPAPSPYVKEPDMVALPTPEEFSAAEAYFESHPEKCKFSNTETGAPINYRQTDSDLSIILTYSFVQYQFQIYAIYAEPTTLQKFFLEKKQRPIDTAEQTWDAEFAFASQQLHETPNFTKLPKSQKIVNGYTFWKMPDGVYAQMRSRTCLGFGMYGVAKLLVNKEGKKLVVKKQYIKSNSNRDDFKHEMTVSQKTGLALANQAFIDDKKNEAFLIMHFYPYTLKSFTELLNKTDAMADILNLFASATEELSCLHFNHFIIHRDIKPDNVFVTEDFKVKFGDFGLADEADASGRSRVVHTRLDDKAPDHYSPEARYRAQFSFSSDIFALGVAYKACFKKLRTSAQRPLLVDERVERNLDELLAEMTRDDHTMRAPHQYISLTLSNILSAVKGEITPESFIEKSDDLKVELRMYQMCGAPFNQHDGNKLYFDDFLEAQFLRENFEKDFFSTTEIKEKIKAIFRHYYEAIKYTKDHKTVLPNGLFADSILAKKARHEEIKETISQSPLFALDHSAETITAEKLSALIDQVSKIYLGQSAREVISAYEFPDYWCAIS